MIIHTPDAETATGHVADVYEGDLADYGVIFAHSRAFMVNPAAHEAFVQLIRSIVPVIGLRDYELATLGAARAIGSGHCLLAHGRKTLSAGLMDDEQVRRFARDYRDAGLSERDVAVIAFAERLSTDASAMTDADSETLRAHGLTDEQIVGVALAAAARNFFSRTLQALAVPLEEMPGLDPETAKALLAR